MTHEKETECYLTNLIYRVYKPNAFGSTFAFFQSHKAQQKMQKSYQANAPRQDTKNYTTDRTTTDNKGLA